MSKTTFHEPYAIDRDYPAFWKEAKEGWTKLTNFTAHIDEELVYHDGPHITTNLLISGEQSAGTNKDTGEPLPTKKLPQVKVTAAEFASGTWVAEKWGLTTIVFPTPNSTTDVRACIQISSAETSKRTDIYTHTGWAKINGQWVFLTTTGGIGKNGLNSKITVQLPTELEHYALPKPQDSADDFKNAMRLVNIGPKSVTWVLLLAAVRASIGDNDFAVHLAGRTGTFKSEISALFQSFYGIGMDSRHLPCSWNSTANALEALCYRTKDALVTIDDFVPQGTAYNVRAIQQKADSVIRAQGNQTGRSRLTDMSSVQATYFPRGIILSTGEDIPEGHSVRGRMMILELSPGDVTAEKLTAAQRVKEAYPRFMASFIEWWSGAGLAESFKEMKKAYRDQYNGIGHSRTPSIMGDLIATAYAIKEFADQKGYLDKANTEDLVKRAVIAIEAAGQLQIQHLHGTDPVQIFAEILRSMMGMGQGHMRTRNGGIPENAPAYGWQVEQAFGETKTYKAQGPKIGWIDPEANELYIDPNSIGLVKAKSGGKLAVNNQTLIKRLVEAGMVTRTDKQRNRNTVRMTLEGHVQTVICMQLSEMMDLGTTDQTGIQSNVE